MIKTFIKIGTLFICSVFYGQQCYPADALPYTGTFDLTQSPQGNYYINSGTGSIPNVPSGFKLWITGSANYSIGNISNSNVEVCNGGTITSSTPAFATTVSLTNLTIGGGGVFNVSVTGPTNLSSFYLGKLRENSVTSFCINGSVNLFSSNWTTYIGSPTGKAWLVRMSSGTLNASNTNVSTSPNVLFVDYGVYFDPNARPATPSLPQGHPDNPFQNNGSCNVPGLRTDLLNYIDTPGTIVTCTKPGLNTGVVSSPKVAITTLNPQGLKDRLNNVTGSLYLEGFNKGLVLPRTNTSNITSPVAGTLIYDITEKCLSLYDGYSWGCLAQTCNDNR
ncbi:hypothetical protein H9Q08_19680 [Chryseobacterium sp. PS-8]|uniref:Uncharacterized protein n=1 Tax=Chryseobacterium indicum TaxID=2766954 RepID=A0ABS9CB12_9FLAO|nr:hypothetical protein [Chryseobacterium sp. PS-8]MCF2221490.1 hypothetical protein [Chryseobacterium sp. PS-8]